jgi:hypothetical protein
MDTDLRNRNCNLWATSMGRGAPGFHRELLKLEMAIPLATVLQHMARKGALHAIKA